MTRSIARALVWWVIGSLSVAACYEALVAFGVVSIGPNPGQGPTHEGIVLAVALLTLVSGGLLLLVASSSHLAVRVVPRWLVAVVPLAAASFVVARWFSYDPYYAPTLRRMSDGGIVPGWWIALLGVLAVAGAWSVVRHPKAGMVVVVLVMWLSAATALVSPGGH